LILYFLTKKLETDFIKEVGNNSPDAGELFNSHSTKKRVF